MSKCEGELSWCVCGRIVQTIYFCEPVQLLIEKNSSFKNRTTLLVWSTADQIKQHKHLATEKQL